MLFVTPNWNPPGASAVYFDEDDGVSHTGTTWAIFAESGNPIPADASALTCGLLCLGTVDRRRSD